MDKSQKIIMIIKALEEVATLLNSSYISRETLQAGFDGYIAKHNPPAFPTDGITQEKAKPLDLGLDSESIKLPNNLIAFDRNKLKKRI